MKNIFEKQMIFFSSDSAVSIGNFSGKVSKLTQNETVIIEQILFFIIRTENNQKSQNPLSATVIKILIWLMMNV